MQTSSVYVHLMASLHQFVPDLRKVFESVLAPPNLKIYENLRQRKIIKIIDFANKMLKIPQLKE